VKRVAAAVAALALALALVALTRLARRPAPQPPSNPAPQAPTKPQTNAETETKTTATTTAAAHRRDGGLAQPSRRVRGAWGSGPGQFGRRRDPETRGEGPASLAVDARGRLLVLDQVNHRVLRFGPDGKPLAPLPLVSDTVEDMLPLKNGVTAVVDRLAESNVQLYDEQGKLLNEVPLKGAQIPEGGGVTGLFTDGKGDLYAEVEHQRLFRIADAQGTSDALRPSIPGRPTRDGRLYLNGAIVDRGAGRVLVRALDGDGATVWETPLDVGAPVLYIALLDSDAAGNVYLGAVTGRESAAPPYRIVDERLVILGLSPSGQPRGSLSLPETPAFEESFRELTVGDDGTIYRMRKDEGGVEIEAYHF
jgi:hypothetical protein